jgi:hypothetical protein
MLEVLNKIQSKALAIRLSATLLDILGKLQYGFIAGGGYSAYTRFSAKPDLPSISEL